MFAKKLPLLFTLWLLLLAPLALAQESTSFDLKGVVKGAKGEPLLAANLQLVKDSSQVLVKVEVSGQDGSFLFSGIPAGKYKLMVLHYDYAMYTSGPIHLQKNTDLGVVTLPERAVALKEVKIEAQKPFVEQHFDKTVLNVENSISAAGSNVLEVLEKAPGVRIDQNDNLSMRGKTGVMVMINGKRVPMSGTELATMLRSLNANEVSKIDLITNPSAKYDAAGNAGIIDIKLKKDDRVGTNGSITSSFGHGKRFKSNQGLQLNHRNRKINVFGSYNYVHRKDFSKLDIYREFFNRNEAYSLQGINDQKNLFSHQINSHNGRLGFDWNVSPKTIVGLVANGVFTDVNRDTENTSLFYDGQRQYDKYTTTESISGTNRNSKALNFNLKHTIDSTGREISADVDYAAFRSGDLQNFTTSYFDTEKPMPDSLLNGDLNGKLTIKSAKVDYSQPLKAIAANLEAGLKSSLVDADNDLRFYDRTSNRNTLDTNRSNHFIYRENINAAYLNVNKKWAKTSLQLGLRVENTIAKGDQVAEYAQVKGERSFDRNYTQLFPSAFLGYTVNKTHNLGLSVSRRIDRPTYNQLNPFVYFIDPSTKSAGNPFLLPQTTYAFEFTHTLKDKFVTKLSYSHTTDVIISVLSPEPQTDPEQIPVVIQQDRNLAKLHYYGASLSVPVSVARWFTSTNNFELYYGLYQGNLVGTNLRNGRPTVNVNSNNVFTLPRNWSAEVIGVFQSREVYGFLDIQPIRHLSLGVQKQLWDKKANIKLNVADVFYSNKVRATTELSGYFERFYQRRDTRVATLSFTYRFGKNQVAPARRRTGGAEDEKRRAG
ncbi:TonB-dependent receptor [Rufibacter latericius]|uniref:TonB-dependent receptor n=1 Tax=Rufibacter latericius TaxID=2487040 RepID=A0A3M9MLA4_9BACT|nr:TonB-dependent receptor [Rufibacter latericius]RNI26259.1 TonB-dependent receptor [Rufibacter latericius]